MAHRGEEIALGPVGAVGFFLGSGEGELGAFALFDLGAHENIERAAGDEDENEDVGDDKAGDAGRKNGGDPSARREVYAEHGFDVALVVEHRLVKADPGAPFVGDDFLIKGPAGRRGP